MPCYAVDPSSLFRMIERELQQGEEPQMIQVPHALAGMRPLHAGAIRSDADKVPKIIEEAFAFRCPLLSASREPRDRS